MAEGSVIQVRKGLGMNTNTRDTRKPNFANLYRCSYSHGTFFFFPPIVFFFP